MDPVPGNRIEPEYFDRTVVLFLQLRVGGEELGTEIGPAHAMLVERYGSRIRLESTPGEGSTFHFTLAAAGVAGRLRGG